MPPCLEFREISHRSANYQNAVAMRDRILRAPLGLSFSEEELEAESADWHLGGFDPSTGELVACLVLSPLTESVAKMRQVAVVENRQRQGIGSSLIQFAEAFALSHGVCQLELHARAEVVAFYLRHDYEVEGPVFLEVTIPHRKMRKALR